MTTAIDSRAEVLRTLEQHALLSAKDLAAAKSASVGGRELLDSLVERKLLTQFQADAIRSHEAEKLILSHFTLLDVIGTGAMGTVYKARSSKDNNLYAIKTVPRKNVINLKAVTEKVEALKQVRHPRVSAMVGVGAQGDRVYMAWPLLEGGAKLDDIVQRQGRLPAKQSAQVGLQIASGLQAYHQYDLFHGLLKSSDVLIGSDRRVRILDFGVGFLLTCERGKAVLSTMTNGKALAKGLDCASPEAIVDPLQRTIYGDQYSLGCILYFCLTGQYPFPDKNPVKKMLGHQFEQPVPVGELAPDTPSRLEAIVMKLLSKTPEERYATTDDLVADLQTVTSDSRVAPPPAPSPTKTPTPKQTISPSALATPRPAPEPEEQVEPEVVEEVAAQPVAVKSGAGKTPWLLVIVGVILGFAVGIVPYVLNILKG